MSWLGHTEMWQKSLILHWAFVQCALCHPVCEEEKMKQGIAGTWIIRILLRPRVVFLLFPKARTFACKLILFWELNLQRLDLSRCCYFCPAPRVFSATGCCGKDLWNGRSAIPSLLLCFPVSPSANIASSPCLFKQIRDIPTPLSINSDWDNLLLVLNESPWILWN